MHKGAFPYHQGNGRKSNGEIYVQLYTIQNLEFKMESQ